MIIDHVYIVSSPKVAELEKLLENIFRSVNIALVNELAMLCRSVWAASTYLGGARRGFGTKPFGYHEVHPWSRGGRTLHPRRSLTTFRGLHARHDFETQLYYPRCQCTNESMPYHVANHVIKVIARRSVSLYDARVLIVGASFKKNVKDIRNSTSEAVINRLTEIGVQHIDITDPWVPEFPVGGKVYHSIDMNAEMLAGYDCVVLVTDHDAFDPGYIVEHSRCIVDTRNMTRDVKFGREKITVLGVTASRPRPVAHHS